MKRETEAIIVGTLFILLFGFVSEFVAARRHYAPVAEEIRGSWSCTADISICPDGKEVGRVPPYCHFSAC